MAFPLFASVLKLPYLSLPLPDVFCISFVPKQRKARSASASIAVGPVRSCEVVEAEHHAMPLPLPVGGPLQHPHPQSLPPRSPVKTVKVCVPTLEDALDDVQVMRKHFAWSYLYVNVVQLDYVKEKKTLDSFFFSSFFFVSSLCSSRSPDPFLFPLLMF